jgi:hypothetical protein
MNLTAFRARFPEFRTATDALVQATLDGASLSLDALVYRSKYDEAHGYLTAHKLVTSPYGKDARLSDDSKESVYWAEFRRIRREVAPRTLLT